MKEPKSIGGIAGRFVERAGDPDALRSSEVLRSWDEIAGDEISRHTEGGRLKDGELLVHVDSPVWANELQLMSEMLRRRLNERLGKETVSGIRFTVGRRVSERNGARRRKLDEEARYAPRGPRGPDLTAEQRASVTRACEGITDPQVRDAAERAMRVALRRRAVGDGG